MQEEELTATRCSHHRVEPVAVLSYVSVTGVCKLGWWDHAVCECCELAIQSKLRKDLYKGQIKKRNIGMLEGLLCNDNGSTFSVSGCLVGGKMGKYVIATLLGSVLCKIEE